MSRVVVSSLPLLLRAAQALAAGAIAAEDFEIPAAEAGIRLHLHNEHPATAGPHVRRHEVLFVHGATFPASSTFDLALPGPGATPLSWMDQLAGHFEELWAAGKPSYDPATIRAPTQLVVGDWDVVTPPWMARGLYAQLVNARGRRLIQLSKVSHFLVISASPAADPRSVELPR